MADGRNGDVHDSDDFGALNEVRRALEAVERQQGEAARERRRLQAQLDSLLKALREDALVLWFDLDRELTEAKGPLGEQLGVSASELLAKFEEFADEETLDALDEANKTVLEDDAAGAYVSDGILRGDDEDVAVTFIHLRRSDEDGELVGTEAIGLVAPVVEADEEVDEGAADPFAVLLENLNQRLLDDASDSSIRRAVQTFGDFLDADRVVVNRYEEKERRFSVAVSWLRGDTEPLEAEERGISISELPWAYSALGAGEALVISEDAELPADAFSEKALYAGAGVESSLLVPMVRREGLSGFLSIQSAREDRDWSNEDIARARSFAMLLGTALVRADVQDDLEKARELAEQATARGEKAEARAEEAEERAKEARDELDAARHEAKELREQVERLESDLRRARADESEARQAAERVEREIEEARREAEEARGQLDELKKDAEDVRTEMRKIQAEFDRAERRSEDAAADALAARKELDDVRERLEEAVRGASELRDVGVRSAFASREDAGVGGGTEKEIFEVDFDDERGTDDEPAAWLPRPMKDDAFDPDATIEMKTEDLGTGFEPDDTSELGSRARDREARSGERDEQPTRVDEGHRWGSDAGDDRDRWGAGARDDGDRWGSAGADDLLETTETTDLDDRGSDLDEDGPETWKEDKASWEDSTDEVDLPAFFRPSAYDEDDDEEPAEHDEDEVEAARRMARDVAGKDDRDDDHFEDTRAPVVLPDFMQRTGDLDEFAAAPHEDFEGEDEDAEEADRLTLPELVGIDTAVGLEDVGGNVELYRDLLGKFRRDYIGAAAKIDSAIDKGNIEVAHLLLHAVKGVAGVLGALRVRDTADDLETKLIGSDPAETRAASARFKDALDEVLTTIADMDGQPEEPRSVEESASGTASSNGADDDGWGRDDDHVSDPMVLRSYLSGLRQHLVGERVRQCQLVMREITARNWPADYNDRVTQLAGLVDAEDFGQAREVFDDLVSRFDER